MTTTGPDSTDPRTSFTALPISDPHNVMGRVGSVVISLIIVVGVVGNLLVLTVIVYCPQLRRPYNAFIASLSATDLVFNVAVMPFYVDTFTHRRWRYSDSVCRWHTYFGTIVIVSSSLHLALIAASRYQLIVRPRFYARWMSSAVAVLSQIAFAWLAAAAMTLPSAVGALPAVIAYSDQLSRCNYDRTASYGALSVIFCGGFIVPCAVMGYCYCMIWRRTREVGLRVNGHSAYQLLKIRQRQQQQQQQQQKQRRQNGASVFTVNSAHCSTVVPSNACINASETAKTEPRPNAAADDRQPATERNENIGGQSSGSSAQRSCDLIDGSLETTAECLDGTLPVVHGESVGHLRTEKLYVVDAKVPVPEQSSSNIAILSNGNDNDAATDNDQNDMDKASRRLTSSSGDHQLTTTSPAECGSKDQESTPPRRSMNTRRSSCDVVQDGSREVDEHVTNENDAKDNLEQLQSANNITIVITPAATLSSADAVAGRESPTRVASCDVSDKDHPHHHLAQNDDARLSAEHSQLPTTPLVCSRSPFRHRRSGGAHEVVGRSPPVSPPSCHRHRSHSLHMILAVFFAFVLTYLPFTVTNLADQRAHLDRNVYMLTSLAFWAGSCVNPLIYGIMNVQFRRAYVSIVVNCWRHTVARCRTG